MRLRAVIATSVVSLLPAAGQAAVDPGREFDDLVARAVRLIAQDEETWSQAQREWSQAQTREFGIRRIAALDPEGAAAAVDRASLGVSARVEGTETGIVVSPFALAGSNDPRLTALNVFIGTLEEDGTRVGARYSLNRHLPALSRTLQRCFVDPEAVASRARELRAPYVAACEILLTARAPSDFPPGPWQAAQAACGNGPYPNAGDRNLDVALVAIPTAVEAVAAAGDAATEAKVHATAGSLSTLADFEIDDYKGCYGDAEAVAERFRIEDWKTPSLDVGFSTHADFFRRQFGFSPDGQPLPRGQLKHWQVRFDVDRRKERTEWTLGAGLGQSREAFAEDLEWSVVPALSLSYVAFSLTGRSLLTGGAIRTEDGKLIPHAVVGIMARSEVSLTRPEWQADKVRAFEAELFIDFKISETFSFRLGAPIRGELKVREPDDQATPPVSKLGKLQWTVPVSVTTVIKL